MRSVLVSVLAGASVLAIAAAASAASTSITINQGVNNSSAHDNVAVVDQSQATPTGTNYDAVTINQDGTYDSVGQIQWWGTVAGVAQIGNGTNATTITQDSSSTGATATVPHHWI